MLARRAFAPCYGALCRLSLSTSETAWARHAPTQSAPRQVQPGNSVTVKGNPSSAVGSTAQEWTEVADQSTGQPYYWNKATGETTALGEPKPSSVGRVQSRVAPVQGAGMGSSLVGLVATGAGVGLVFSLIGRIF